MMFMIAIWSCCINFRDGVFFTFRSCFQNWHSTASDK